MRNGDIVPAPQGGATAGPARELPIEFHGKASEYFGIWIVNLLLTIATLGIWSAWAKVRRKRYLLGNTTLDGHAFDYHAKGKQILIGRLIVLGVLVSNSVLQKVSPLAAGIEGLLIVGLFPWVINRSLRFNARMTSWRNVRFGFDGTYFEALKAFYLAPLAGVLTAGFLTPWARRVYANFFVRNHWFGTAKFDGDPRLWPFYRSALQSLFGVVVIAIPLYMIMTVVAAAFIVVLRNHGADIPPDAMGMPGAIAMTFAFFGSFVVVAPFYHALTFNIVLNAATLEGGHRFRANLSGFRYAWIALSNFMVQAPSLFLLWPWAVVRQWRYHCEHVAAVPAGALDAFIDTEQKAGGAFGSEFADIEGFDFGL